MADVDYHKVSTHSSSKMPLDNADDFPSDESLSFKSFICIQNQQVTPVSGYTHQIRHAKKASFEFEFRQPKTALVTDAPRNNYYKKQALFPLVAIGYAPRNNGSMENMFSNSRALSRAMPVRVRESQLVQQNCSMVVKKPSQSDDKRSKNKLSCFDGSDRKPNKKGINVQDEKRTNEGRRFGQKIFMCATPCKDCRSIESAPLTAEQVKGNRRSL